MPAYNVIINGKASQPQVANNMAQLAKNTILASLPFHCFRLALSENMGIGESNNHESIGTVMARNKWLVVRAVKPKVLLRKTSKTPVANSPPAGVGMPIKLTVWRVSILNFPKRRAAQIGYRKEIKPMFGFVKSSVPKPPFCEKRNKKMIPGKTPKVTQSASESSCLPNSECTLSARAAKPSRKSASSAIATSHGTNCILPEKQPTIPITPQSRFIMVSPLGMCFIIIKKYGRKVQFFYLFAFILPKINIKWI